MNRLIFHKDGDEKSDWNKAGKILRSPVRKLLFFVHCYLIKIEILPLRSLKSSWINKQSLSCFLNLISSGSIVVATLAYIASEGHRRNNEVLNAWQTLTSAYEQSGNGGRIQALEFLNASPGTSWRRKFPWFCAPISLCVWPPEDLSGINLAVSLVSMTQSDFSGKDIISSKGSGVYLVGVSLPSATLRNANFRGANLSYSNLENADLGSADLSLAILRFSSLKGADLLKVNLAMSDLQGANLIGVYLGGSDLRDADLAGTQLQQANLVKTDFRNVDLRHSNLEDADLEMSNLQGADLTSSNLNRANLTKADLRGAKNLTESQLEGAYLCETLVSQGFFENVNLNSDC